MRLLIVSALSVLVLSGCGSRAVDVEYKPEVAATGSDWFPVPTEEPVRVTSTDRSVERPPVRIAAPLDSGGSASPLEVRQGIDSFGNISLEVNRDPSLTWELLNIAVSRLEWPVADRNRTEYRLELSDQERVERGFFSRTRSFFTKNSQTVNLILVPKVSATGIAAEYGDDEALSAEENRRLMTRLRDELLQVQ